MPLVRWMIRWRKGRLGAITNMQIGEGLLGIEVPRGWLIFKGPLEKGLFSMGELVLSEVGIHFMGV